MSTAAPAPSDEHKFDRDRKPLEETDSAQAEASEYGIYGYADHASEAEARQMESSPEADTIQEPEPAPQGIKRAKGGQNIRESGHGAGFDQPLDPPQREASRSPLPHTTSKGDQH